MRGWLAAWQPASLGSAEQIADRRSAQAQQVCVPAHRSASMDATGSSSCGRPGEGDSSRCTRSSAGQRTREWQGGGCEWLESQQCAFRVPDASPLQLLTPGCAVLALPTPHSILQPSHLRCRGRCQSRAPGAQAQALRRRGRPLCGAPEAPPGWSCMGGKREWGKRQAGSVVQFYLAGQTGGLI